MSAMRETWVRFLGRKDPLKKGLATALVFLPEESHGQRSLVGYSPQGHKELSNKRAEAQSGCYPTAEIDSFFQLDCL